jgi:hypothetical protein
MVAALSKVPSATSSADTDPATVRPTARPPADSSRHKLLFNILYSSLRWM